jgi:MtN3 and saliva related transmembrane protein
VTGTGTRQLTLMVKALIATGTFFDAQPILKMPGVICGKLIGSILQIFIMNSITLLGLLAAFCTTISFLPQAIKTIQTRNTSGISLYMYALFTFGTLFWLLYGLLSHNLPVTVANAITLLFAVVILSYKVKYK